MQDEGKEMLNKSKKMRKELAEEMKGRYESWTNLLTAIQNGISVGKKPFEFPLLKGRGTLSGITKEMVQTRVRAIKNEMKKRREALRRQS